MSLHDKMLCAACGQPRHAHPLVPTIVPKVMPFVNGGSRDGRCKAWQEPHPKPTS